MTLHLIKLCVGVDEIAELARWQKKRMAERRAKKLKRKLIHRTRSTPKRADELLDGGSLYWVIKGVIRVRQRLVAIEPGRRDDGTPCCELALDGRLVRTMPRPVRAFQGWRYLEAKDAPPDLGAGGEGLAAMPPRMVEELRLLGLL
jgi:hypothetical protein